MDGSLFSATLFNITYMPDRKLVKILVNGISDLSGNVTAAVSIVAYGYTALTEKLDPCGVKGFKGMCPMTEGVIVLDSTIDVPDSVADKIPGIFGSCCKAGSTG